MRLLESAWLRELQDEHQHICECYGIDLDLPVFELSDGTGRLACWDPVAGKIVLSRTLLRNHPWSAVLQVLKHEMAHQLVSQRFGSSPKAASSHGREFLVACKLLGVLPEFSTPRAPDPARVEALWKTERKTPSSRLEKVRKLLALADSANEHEASLALLRAREIMEKYQLEMEAAEEQAWERGLVCRSIDQGRKRLPRYQVHICGLLMKHFQVRCVIVDQYDQHSQERFKMIEIFGSRENVAVAEYCFHFLENHLQMRWRRQKRTIHGHAGRQRNSFMIGMVRGFGERMETMASKQYTTTPTADETSRELVHRQHIMEQRIDEFIGCYYPRLRRKRTGSLSLYKDSFEQGRAAGRELDFSRGLSETGRQTPLLEN